MRLSATLKTWMRLSATLTLFLSEWATDTECLQGDEHEAEEEEAEEEEHEWPELSWKSIIERVVNIRSSYPLRA